MPPFYVLIGCDLPLIAPFIIGTAGHLSVPSEVSIVLIILHAGHLQCMLNNTSNVYLSNRLGYIIDTMSAWDCSFTLQTGESCVAILP